MKNKVFVSLSLSVFLSSAFIASEALAVSQKQTQVSVSSVTTAEAESYFNAFLEQQKKRLRK